MDHAKLASEVAQLRTYVYQELGEEGEFQSELVGMFSHLLATVSDLRDAAVIAQSELQSGNIRDALTAFFDVVEATCDISDKRVQLEQAFPDYIEDIDALLRNPDGTSR
jgi:hypothetical protein